MMALRDSERAWLGKHFITVAASSVFVYPFPFTHFSCRAISFCSYKYMNPSSGSFVSSNTLPLIRHSAFRGVAECFCSGENYFVSFKKTPAPGFCTFLISGTICSQISYYFPKLFSQAFPEDILSDKMLTLAFFYPLCGVLFYCSCLFLQFLFLGFTESTFASESGDSVPVVYQRSCACLCWINPRACFMIYSQSKLNN